MPKTSFLILPDSGQNQRVDIHLSQIYPQLSRSYIQKLTQEDRVKINGQNVKSSYRLKAGDLVEIDISDFVPQKDPLLPENIPLTSLYEDDYILVIDKPSGLVVHPGAGTSHHTLVNALLFHCPALRDVGDANRPGIVHRLDKDTSGVMVVAKTQMVHEELQRQFKAREVEKLYLGLVWGRVPEKTGQIVWAIGRHEKQRQRISIRTKKPKEAETHFTVRQEWSDFSLLEIKPLTGRTHQIRVHLSASGHPIVGDTIYGRKRTKLPISRLFLHALQLTFLHPGTKEKVEFNSPLPQELQEYLEKLSP
ncbi:MAG: RluA family pseudouridine synthase [Candidatus Aminicenantes bacterium]|nr:RluA family pseudouridine synthase [Candidatus Aminicenantes bacterium]